MKHIASFLIAAILCSQASAATRVTFAIVVDESADVWLGGDEESVRRAAVEQGRIAAELIAPIGVTLDLVSTEVSAAKPTSAHPVDVLAGLKLRPADITVLITGVPLLIREQMYRGYALPYSVCEGKGRAVVSVQGDGYDGETLAHEIGHVMGMPHDGWTPCAGESPEAYIMSARVVGNTSFSQCSIDQAKFLLSLPGCLTSDDADVSVAPTPAAGGGGAFEWLILGWLALLAFLLAFCRRDR